MFTFCNYRVLGILLSTSPASCSILAALCSPFASTYRALDILLSTFAAMYRTLGSQTWIIAGIYGIPCLLALGLLAWLLVLGSCGLTSFLACALFWSVPAWPPAFSTA